MAYKKQFRDIQSTSLISKSVIREGHWYQPYIHSNPKNFLRAQKSHFSNVNYNAITTNAEKKARAVFDAIILYFEKRVKKFMKLSKIKNKEDIIPTLSSFHDNYNNLMTTNIQVADDTTKALKGNIKTQKEFIEAQNPIVTNQLWELVNRTYNNYDDEMFEEAMRLTGGDAKKARKNIKAGKRTTVIELFAPVNYLTTALKDMNIDLPPDLMGEFLLTMMAEDPEGMAKLSKNAQKLSKILAELDKEEKKAIKRQLQTTVVPKKARASKGQQFKSKVVKGTSPANYYAAQFGTTINEPGVQRVMVNTIANGIGSVVSSFESNLTGDVDKSKDLSDGVIKATFRKTKNTEEEFLIGIDMKYNTKVYDGAIKYGRKASAVPRKVAELEPLFDTGVLNDITYLITNLYYFDRQNSKEYIQAILAVARFIQGLLLLLPAQTQGNEATFISWTPGQITKKLKGDTRIFVVINDNLFLITDFLKEVEDSVFSLESATKDGSALLSPGAGYDRMRNSLWKVLESLAADEEVGKLQKNRPVGKYFDAKKAVLAKLKKGDSTYSALKSEVANKTTGSKILDGFKYSPLGDALWIKTSGGSA